MGTAKMPDVVNGYHWELYNSTEDYSQYNDLAASNPAKLEELKALFDQHRCRGSPRPDRTPRLLLVHDMPP